MIRKREFIWNTIGSFISALLNAIILAFCTRINGIEIAGIFAISYASMCILNSIGDFGLRIYQSTDVERKSNFSEYLVARIVAQVLMYVIGIIFVCIKGYTHEKLFILLLLLAFRIIENLSDSYQAEFQLNGRLELGGKSIVYRNVLGLLAFFALDILTKNILIALIGLVIAQLIVFILYDLRLIKQFTKTTLKVNKKQVVKILKDCLPLAISTVISMYVINAVKYAIDDFGDYEMQTYFNIIYMPTFVINLVSVFIIKPFLKPFGDTWTKKEYMKFVKMIGIIIAVLALATLCVEAGCFLLGIPFLNLLYGVELSMYKVDLLLLVLSGFLYACANVLFNALGTMRHQKLTTITYVLTAIFALFVPALWVKNYGMRGATYSCMAVMGLLFVFMLVFFVYVLFDTKRKKNKA